MSSILPAAFTAMLITGLTTPVVRRLVLSVGLVDRPNERSSHHMPTPRAGGLAVVFGVGFAVLLTGEVSSVLVVAAACAAAVALISLVDDVRSLPFWSRLAVHTAAAAATVIGLRLPIANLDVPGFSVELPVWLGMSLGVTYVVAFSNFFNFMDGINGLAAGQAALTAATLAALLSLGGCDPAALVAGAVCGSAAGFLPYNYPSARIFLGDVGSVTLGFMIAVLSLVASRRGGVPWTAVLLINGLFLYDAASTLVKRASRRENLIRPHREHNYQLLVLHGWSHRVVSLGLWLVTTVCCLAGTLYARSRSIPLGWVSLLITLALLAATSLVAHRRGMVRLKRMFGIR